MPRAPAPPSVELAPMDAAAPTTSASMVVLLPAETVTAP